MDCSAPGSSVHRISRQEYWSGLPFPSPGESSWPRDRTWVSCIAGGFFTNWATGEPLLHLKDPKLKNKLESQLTFCSTSNLCAASMSGAMKRSFIQGLQRKHVTPSANVNRCQGPQFWKCHFPGICLILPHNRAHQVIDLLQWSGGFQGAEELYALAGCKKLDGQHWNKEGWGDGWLVWLHAWGV